MFINTSIYKLVYAGQDKVGSACEVAYRPEEVSESTVESTPSEAYVRNTDNHRSWRNFINLGINRTLVSFPVEKLKKKNIFYFIILRFVLSPSHATNLAKSFIRLFVTISLVYFMLIDISRNINIFLFILFVFQGKQSAAKSDTKQD